MAETFSDTNSSDSAEISASAVTAAVSAAFKPQSGRNFNGVVSYYYYTCMLAKFCILFQPLKKKQPSQLLKDLNLISA